MPPEWQPGQAAALEAPEELGTGREAGDAAWDAATSRHRLALALSSAAAAAAIANIFLRVSRFAFVPWFLFSSSSYCWSVCPPLASSDKWHHLYSPQELGT